MLDVFALLPQTYFYPFYSVLCTGRLTCPGPLFSFYLHLAKRPRKRWERGREGCLAMLPLSPSAGFPQAGCVPLPKVTLIVSSSCLNTLLASIRNPLLLFRCTHAESSAITSSGVLPAVLWCPYSCLYLCTQPLCETVLE